MSVHRITSIGKRYIVFGIVLISWLNGCATTDPTRCARFEIFHQNSNYETRYQYSKTDSKKAERMFRASGATVAPQVSWYTLRVHTDSVRPCEHLYLIKDIYLHRSTGGKLALEEIREFYTAKGKLIAVKKENISEQLNTTGYYSASVPLPIPPTAPTGKYRVVSKLKITSVEGHEQVLASTNAEFWIRQN